VSLGFHTPRRPLHNSSSNSSSSSRREPFALHRVRSTTGGGDSSGNSGGSGDGGGGGASGAAGTFDAASAVEDELRSRQLVRLSDMYEDNATSDDDVDDDDGDDDDDGGRELAEEGGSGGGGSRSDAGKGTTTATTKKQKKQKNQGWRNRVRQLKEEEAAALHAGGGDGGGDDDETDDEADDEADFRFALDQAQSDFTEDAAAAPNAPSTAGNAGPEEAGRFQIGGHASGSGGGGGGFTVQQLAVVRRMWRRQKHEVEAAHSKAVAVREQGSRVWAELMDAQSGEQRAFREAESLGKELRRLKGQGLDKESVGVVQEVEKELKDILVRVTAEKEKKIRVTLEVEREQRLCVICVEAEKTMLLLPCRHLCLCGPCSASPQVLACPLCRATIVDRISVFS